MMRLAVVRLVRLVPGLAAPGRGALGRGARGAFRLGALGLATLGATLGLAACAGGETAVAPADAPTPTVVEQATSYVDFGGDPGEPCHWRRTYYRVEDSDGRVFNAHSNLSGPPWNQHVSRDSVPWARFWSEEQPAGYSAQMGFEVGDTSEARRILEVLAESHERGEAVVAVFDEAPGLQGRVGGERGPSLEEFRSISPGEVFGLTLLRGCVMRGGYMMVGKSELDRGALVMMIDPPGR